MAPAGELLSPFDEPPGLDLVLAAADETTNRSLIPLLRLGGFAVRSTHGHAEALAALEQSLPDVLIAETELPGGTGYDLVGALRALAGGRLPAVIVLACRPGGGGDLTPAIHAGADVVLDHPVAWGVLARLLGQVLASRPLDRQAASRRTLWRTNYDLRMRDV